MTAMMKTPIMAIDMVRELSAESNKKLSPIPV